MTNPPRVVIVGAGFGGMQAAQSLSGCGAEVLLIDRHNYNTFIPLLYQVAGAQIEPAAIAYPLRNVVRRARNVRFLMATVQHIDFAQRRVTTDRTVLTYDYLVLATGSYTRFPQQASGAEYVYSMRTLPEAIALRNQILSCFEQAAWEPDPARRQWLLRFVVVGGGPTGVEVAGILTELRRVLRRDYPTLDLSQMQIAMVQSGDRPLADLPPRLGRYTARTLRRLGVSVYLQSRVSRVTPDGADLQDGTHLAAATVIWTAGLQAVHPDTSGDLETADKGKLVVQPTLQLVEQTHVYGVGDVAYVTQGGKALTGVAPEALQQGVAVARNIKRQLNGRSPRPFRYFNKGRLAIIGGYAGVGKIGPLPLTGFLPWLMWLLVHVVYLPGYRSRLFVLLSWLQAYLLGYRAMRLILPTVVASSYPALQRDRR